MKKTQQNRRRQSRLFLIESPFQLLSAIEAAAAIHPEDEAFLIIMRRQSERSRNERQIEQLVPLFAWDQVFHLDLADCGPIQRQWRIFWLITRLRSALSHGLSASFIGEFRWDFMHLIVNVLRSRESWLLDDGTAILRLRENFKLGWKAEKIDRDLGPIRRLILYLLYLGGHRGEPEQYRGIFTGFHQFFEHPCVLPNRFDYLTGLSCCKEPAVKHIIVGQKLSESEVCPLDVEFKAVARLTTDLRAQGIEPVYIPHRDDSSEKLKQFTKRLGLVVYPLDTVIEVAAVTGAINVASINGFYSTALFTLGQMLQHTCVCAYRFSETDISAVHRENVMAIYDTLSATGANIVKLPPLNQLN
ncbi:polysialyltransferase family glycosyltransferase [Actibacterium pelagium]|uniref:polysialyltransferase family glycosyltransferase n=1 Tax=Actibacterium pelagium TaxID=2029103 RepID=UPI000BAB142B|nr:polysialyltransferase family glycosyltransferase [Actibacterium pelagium]